MIATLIFQTWGLQYTTATKSSFITCLYVLLVPILDMLILKRRLSSFHPIFVASALVGTALICDFQAGQWNLGDFLTLLCALAATLQIFWLGLIAKRLPSSLVFNFMQSLWSLVMPLGLALTLEKWPGFPMTGLPLLGLLALSFGSTLGAFGLQVSAQRHLSPSVASLLCLLESPFATIYAFYFLGEHLSRTQWLGAGLILLSVIAATLLDIHLEAKTNVST